MTSAEGRDHCLLGNQKRMIGVKIRRFRVQNVLASETSDVFLLQK